MVTPGGHDDEDLGVLKPIASLAHCRTEPLNLLLKEILVLTLRDSFLYVEDVCWSFTSVMVASDLEAWTVSHSAKPLVDVGAYFVVGHLLNDLGTLLLILARIHLVKMVGFNNGCVADKIGVHRHNQGSEGWCVGEGLPPQVQVRSLSPQRRMTASSNG